MPRSSRGQSGRLAGKPMGCTAPRSDPDKPEVLRAGDVPVHQRRPAPRPLVELRAGRRRTPATSACGASTSLFPPGFDAFGLPAEDAAIKNGIHPYHVDHGQHRPHGAPVADHGRRVRLDRGGRHLPARSTTAGTSGSSCSSTSAAWPTGRRRRSTGARTTACWPTSRSTTAAAGAAARRWSSATWSSGSSASPQYADELLDFSEHRLARAHQDDADATGSAAPKASSSTCRSTATPDAKIAVFTTRVDTVFGMTYVVLAPEHPLVAAADRAGSPGRGRGLRRPGAPRRPRSSACRPSARRPASSSAATRSTRPTASACRSGSPTTCWRTTAPAPSWPCRPRRARLRVRARSSACRFASSCARRTRRTT